jgi:SAM-dependent methyltransferase
VKEYYDKDYHLLVHSRHIADDEYYRARSEASARLNFQGVLVNTENCVLEFGCGYGHNIACLPNAWGYDISDLARKECVRHGIRVYSSIEQIPLGFFDIILSRHTLEHLEDPLGNLVLLGRFLKPDGKLILILPKEKHSYSSYKPDMNQHLFCWNFRAINNLLMRAGYKIVLNKYQSVVGYQALLPIRKYLGKKIYFYSTLLAGKIFDVTELVVHAMINNAKTNDSL